MTGVMSCFQQEGEEERANEDVIREWNLEGIDEHSVLGQVSGSYTNLLCKWSSAALANSYWRRSVR